MPLKRVRHNLDTKQDEMKKRNLEARRKADEFFGRAIPKGWCPVCFVDHRRAKEGVPAECFQRAAKGDVSTLTEFERYLKDNRLGKFV